MARHAKYALRRARISKVFDLPPAVPAAETAGAIGLITGQDGQVFDLVAAGTAAVGAVVADERAVAEQEEVGVRVEKGTAGVATEAVDVPSVTGCRVVSTLTCWVSGWDRHT